MPETRKCPPLGVGSVDFGALHEADAKGGDLEKAIEKARQPAEAPPAASKSPKKPTALAAD